MPTTKTSSTPTADVDPGVALLEAVGHQQDIERRLVDGEQVSTGEFAEAAHRVELAEARVAASTIRETEAAAAAKQAAIAEVVDSLTDGRLGAEARRLVELHDQAVAVLAELHLEAGRYCEGIRVAANQLAAIDRPALVRRDREDGELRINLVNGKLKLADGRLFDFEQDVPDKLVAEAAGTVVPLEKLRTVNNVTVQHQRTVGRLRDVAQAGTVNQ